MYLHNNRSTRYFQVLGPGRVLLRLKAPAGTVARAAVMHPGEPEGARVMYPCFRTKRYEYFQVEFLSKNPWEAVYAFRLTDFAGRISYLPAAGRPFIRRWRSGDLSPVPAWVKDSFFYQVFPDRFRNGDLSNDPPGVLPWGSPPTADGFTGGDLEGIRQGIPYFKRLGVDALYLNPIFASPSNHRYNTTDYLAIDRYLGTTGEFQRFVRTLHSAGIRVILDGVFNHSGTGFAPFQDLLRRGRDSPYRDWYYCHGFPVRSSGGVNYDCWWGIPELPKLKVTDPAVEKYLVEVARYWIASGGIDGWRLDVPNELPPTFLKKLYHRVKATSPEAYVVGEIWHDARFWLLGGLMDGVMNYPFREIVLDRFARHRYGFEVMELLLGRLRIWYPELNTQALLNLLGSHDTPRVITVFEEELAKVEGHSGSRKEALEHLRPALLLQFTYPGAPMVFYGDEVGLSGGPEPDCRRCMPWDESLWDRDLLALYRTLGRLRRNLESLRRGSFQPLVARGDTYAFVRRLEGERVLVFLNAGHDYGTVVIRASDLGLPEGAAVEDYLGGGSFRCTGGRLEVGVAGNWGAIFRLPAGRGS